ncbi:nuclear transport factor 2 family protein [Halorubrum gandharaense]
MGDTNGDPGTTPADAARLVRRYYEVVDAEAYEELFDLFDDDVVYERPGQPPIEGKAAFREFYETGRPLEDGTHEVHSVVVNPPNETASDDGDGSDESGDDHTNATAPAGPTVAVRGTFSGIQDGDRVSFGFADFHEFDGGVIARRYTFTDRDEV